MSIMLVNCSKCRTPLQLPPGAKSIRCAVCQGITHIADPRGAPSPASSQHQPPPSYYGGYQPPPPNPQQYSPDPSSSHGKKRAVVCGISYRYSRHELKGCLNDANCMKYLLINKFKFPEPSILMLTEEERDPLRKPTKHNIRMAMFWLMQGCQAGDSLVFHYSGHGSQQRNRTGDEVDGYDETLLPLDFETQGMLVDDEINAAIVRPLPRGARLHAIIDACHSGTVLDLPYFCRLSRDGRYVWEDHRPRTGVWKGTSGGEAISISGCDDNQTSADTSALSKITSTGAMTYCFIQAIEKGGAGTTYGSLLNAMRNTIRQTGASTGGGGGPVTTLLTMLLTGGSYGGGLTQEPQLTSSEPFEIHTKPFYL
uniref:TSA: Wollemia nobilis Ref_Wollemi_Transcript_8267_1840 transcribed RNA sequence n=1 Tax=Wollemia nobilis TaxID=56998 RepID=A0A0C9S9A8_9CONI